MSNKSRWEMFKEKKGGVTPLDAINPYSPRANEETAANRMSICESCPRLIKVTHQCRECGCLMKIKTKLLDARCPLGKW
jgi:hypothetical protein